MTADIGTEDILAILKGLVSPALGCTEPIAVALAAAKAREELGKIPGRVKVEVSSNVYKNSLGVYIPGTNEKGLLMAAALGIVAGESALKLQVLQKINAGDIEKARAIIAEDRIIVAPLVKREGLFIRVNADEACEVIIEGKHDQIVSVIINGCAVVITEHREQNRTDYVMQLGTLKLTEIRKLIEAIEPEQLDFINDGIKMNLEIASRGMEKKYGLGLGPALENLKNNSILGDDLAGRTRMLTAAAADARMSGARLPVMTSGGSGNQGIAAIVPVALTAKKFAVSEDKLIRAVALSHMINIYIKQYTGKLSAVCGCAISAGAGAAAAVAWMLGGSDEQISGAVKNMIGNLFGMICDGAKASCSFKLSTASGEAIIAAMLALNGTIISEQDGIIFPTAEETIMNMGEICVKGLQVADQTILDVMMKKEK